MTSALMSQALFGALALVMFGLGLSLQAADFARLRQHPKAVALALLLQVLVLPALCWGLVVLMGVSPLYAVGMLLLAASPGGVSANLFSHLFGGNVAMNISLTAINTLLSIVTLPLISNWAIGHFAGGGQVVPLQFGKVAEVIAVVLVPVLLGMAVRWRFAGFAARMERPMKALSALVLALFALGAMAKEWQALGQSFGEIGAAVIAFNLLSLSAGYGLPRAAGLERRIAVAIGFEIGIHNSTLAIFIALAVLNDFRLALPAAVYSISMYMTAAAFGFLFLRQLRQREEGGVRPA